MRLRRRDWREDELMTCAAACRTKGAPVDRGRGPAGTSSGDAASRIEGSSLEEVSAGPSMIALR